VVQAPEGNIAVGDAAVFSPLEESLGHLVRRTQQLQTFHWSATLDSGLTGAQYAVLTVVAAYPNARRTELEGLSALDRSTSAEVISRLQGNSWIERERASHDGRRSHLTLTPPARAALPAITAQVQRVQDLVTSALTQAETEELVELLATVAYADAPDLRALEPTDPRASVLGFATTPTHLLRRAEQRHQRLWSTLVGGQTTPTQYAVLCAIAYEALDQKTVSALASLDTSTGADVISRLRRQSLLTVTPDARDRRRNLVRLVPETFDLVADLTRRAEAVHHELSAPLPAAETARLKHLLRTISFPEEISHTGSRPE
jgi:DNA-binding MarR family transcriptional regulator